MTSGLGSLFWENSVKNARFETILKVFDALGAKVNFSVELNGE